MNAKKNSDGADNTDDSHADNTRTTRLEVAATRTTKGTGVFNPVCLFCRQQRKSPWLMSKLKGFEKTILKYVEWLEDSRLASMVSEGDFIAKEVRYPGCCRVKYQIPAEAKFKEKTKQNAVAKRRLQYVSRGLKSMAQRTSEIFYCSMFVY